MDSSHSIINSNFKRIKMTMRLRLRLDVQVKSIVHLNYSYIDIHILID